MEIVYIFFKSEKTLWRFVKQVARSEYKYLGADKLKV